MPTAQHLRAQIEANLAKRIPSALTPSPKIAYTVAPTGIREIDELLHGGFPIGALSEIVGPECSGRTSLALTFVANLTQAGKVCAWVDVSDILHPESAAALGVDLSRLLWIRCGRSPESAPLPVRTWIAHGRKASQAKAGISSGRRRSSPNGSERPFDSSQQFADYSSPLRGSTTQNAATS